MTKTSSVCPSEEEGLFDVESPEATQFEPLVSPSPLVSWRGDHNVEKGRQLFLLTPLPIGKSEFLKHQNASKLKLKRFLPNAASNQPLEASKETSDDVLVLEPMKTTELVNSIDHVMDLCEPLSSPILRRKIESELYLLLAQNIIHLCQCCKFLKTIYEMFIFISKAYLQKQFARISMREGLERGTHLFHIKLRALSSLWAARPREYA